MQKKTSILKGTEGSLLNPPFIQKQFRNNSEIIQKQFRNNSEIIQKQFRNKGGISEAKKGVREALLL